MATVAEAQHGPSIDEWVELIRARGIRRHGEIVAMLKGEHHMTHAQLVGWLREAYEAAG